MGSCSRTPLLLFESSALRFSVTCTIAIFLGFSDALSSSSQVQKAGPWKKESEEERGRGKPTKSLTDFF